MNTLERHSRNLSPTCAVFYLAGHLLLSASFSAARGQQAHDYQPQFQKVVYRPNVPVTISRTATKVGPTRFFGSFRLGDKTFAIHFYDTSRVLPKARGLERNSRLDVFRLTASSSWQRIQTLPVTRQVDADARSDSLTIETQALWLDPKKTIPMIHLKIMEHEDRKSMPVGNRTDIYGVLLNKPDPKAFLSLQGYIPYSNSTVTLSEVSYPDAKGELTILAVTSDPGQNSYVAYAWTGERWKTVGASTSDNGYETALVWNGSKFVPLANKGETP